jgi:hypothetical protein
MQGLLQHVLTTSGITCIGSTHHKQTVVRLAGVGWLEMKNNGQQVQLQTQRTKTWL